MATKIEELVQSLQREVTRILTLLEGVQQEVKAADLRELRERLRELETKLNVLNISQVPGQIAVLQEQVAELKKWKEESDRRRWQVLLAIGVCVLTFTSNIVINLLLFFARKPG